METSRFLDVQLLAEYIHMSKSTVYKMVSNKTIPFNKIGTRTLFDKVQIDEWILGNGEKVIDLPSVPQFKVAVKDTPALIRNKSFKYGNISLRA